MQVMTFRSASGPVTAPVAKLGGRPHWLDEPFWPLTGIGTPMTFVGQFAAGGGRMAYLFITDDDEDGTAETYDPEAGENALLIQPGGRIPPFVRGTRAAEGPSLWRRGATWTERVPVELLVRPRPPTPAEAAALATRLAYQDGELAGDYSLPLPDRDVFMATPHSYIGGRPLFAQPAALPACAAWTFLFQIEDAEGIDDDPYALNFGGGTGYAFVSEDGLEGRFFWNCT